MESRIINSKRNIIGMMINKIVGLLFPFLSRTVMIYYLGTIYLGLNSLFTSILSVLSLAELGVGTAMVFSMYEPIATGDSETVCALLNLYRQLYRIIGTIILIIGTLFTPFLTKIISGERPEDINIYIVYFIDLFNTVISYYMFAYKEAILIASQRMDLLSNINTIVCIFLNLGQTLILILTRNYYLYCIILPASTIIGMLGRSYIVNLRFPQYFCNGRISDSLKHDIKKRVVGLFIYKVCDVLRFSLDSIVLSAFLGLTVLAKYNNYFYIINAIAGILGVISTSITASIGNSIVKESQSKNYKDFQKIQLIYMWMAGFCTVSLYCLYYPFMHLWVGESLMFDNFTVVFFCLYFFVNRWGDICFAYRQAVGLWWQDRLRPIVEAVINAVLNVLLVQHIGVIGVLLSTIIGLVFINSIWGSRILFKYYFTNFHQIEYVGRLFVYSVITVFACAVTDGFGYLILKLFTPKSMIFVLLIKGLMCVIVANVIFAIAYSKLKEFKDSKDLVISVLKTKIVPAKTS